LRLLGLTANIHSNSVPFLTHALQVFQTDPSSPNTCLSSVRFQLYYFSGSSPKVVNVNFTVAEFDTATNTVVASAALATAPFSIRCASGTFAGTNLFEAAFDKCVALNPSRYVHGSDGGTYGSGAGVRTWQSSNPYSFHPFLVDSSCRKR